MKAARRFQGARPRERQPRIDLGRLVRVAGVTVVLTAALAVLAAAGVVLYRYLDAPLRVVAVDGDIRHLRRSDIEDLVSHHLDGGFLTLDMRALQRGLEEHPWIASVRARREWPNALYLHIDEEAPVARWRGGEFLNGRGEVLPGVPADDFKDLPDLAGPEDSEAEVMATYQALGAQLAGAGLRIERLVRDDEGLSLRLVGGTELMLGRADTDARLARFLVLWRQALAVRRDELGRVDARYDNGVAVHWRAAPAAAGRAG
jgi:cell division protein FtsQ